MNTANHQQPFIRLGLLSCLLCLFTLTSCSNLSQHQEITTTREIDLANIRSRIKTPPQSSIILEQEEGLPGQQDRPPGADIIQGDGTNQPLLKIMKQTDPTQATPKGDDLQAGPGVTLNFDNADIYEVIHLIGDMLGINYIIDPGVKGVVNIRSSKEIPQTQLQDVFLKILHINGLDMRDEGGHSYIFASSKPYSGTFSPLDNVSKLKRSSRIILQLVPLLHLQADDSIKLVESYLSLKGSIQTLPSHNWLLINDYESNVIDILTILAKLDISPLSSLNVRLVRIQNAPLEEIKDELSEIFTALHINKKGTEGGLAIVPLEQVNSLLLVSPSCFLVENGVRWIKELDIAVGSDRDNIYIYNAKNTVASELAELVNRLISDDIPTTPRKTATTAKPQNKTTPKSPLARSSMRFAGFPILLADDTRNIVLIRALPPDYSRLVKLLGRLDNLPRQVLVEVIVAEVYLKDELSLGVEWAIDNNLLGWNNGTKYSMDIASTVFNTENTITNGLSMLVNNGTDVKGLLNALAGTTDISILSSPQVLVLNNETATVNVGEEIPIVTTVTTVTQNNADADKVDKTIQYKDTGVILEVTPQINYDGIIILDIKQTISTALDIPEDGVQSQPIRKRELKTKLAVKDGQSILIGGLISNNKTVSDSGIPLIKDIPILGYLFNYESHKMEKTELLIMLTPYVIESEQVMDQYINEFQSKMNDLRNELHAK